MAFSSPSNSRNSFWPANSGLQVRFDIPYFLGAGPCEYQLTVHATSFRGLWITNLHWDFGDGSTLDVAFAVGSQVVDSRLHGYARAGTYVVAVTATDSAGNTGMGYWGLSDAFPTSCIRGLGPSERSVPATIWNAMIQLRNSLQLPQKDQLYVYGFLTGVDT